jgi:hypothetical protein
VRNGRWLTVARLHMGRGVSPQSETSFSVGGHRVQIYPHFQGGVSGRGPYNQVNVEKWGKD